MMASLLTDGSMAEALLQGAWLRAPPLVTTPVPVVRCFMARARTPKTTPRSTASDRALKTAPAATASSAAVARRAYDLYVARGREDGHDVDDWLQAERELQTAAGASEAI